MTEIYVMHRTEQMESARAEFSIIWAEVIRLEPLLDTPGYQARGWLDFLRDKNLLNPKPPTS